MDKGYLTSLIFNGTGAVFIIYILNKLSNREKWQRWWIKIGKRLTAFGRGKVGKSFWEKIEDFLEDRMKLMLSGLISGWNSDNDKD